MKLFEKTSQIENGIISVSKRHIDGIFYEHSHDFFEIEYIIKGSGKYFIDGKEYPIHDKMLFFMSPSNFHAIENCNAEIINIMFSCNLCDSCTLFNLFSPNTDSAIQFSDKDSILIEQLLFEILSSKQTDYQLQFLRCLLYKLSSIFTKRYDKTITHIQSAIVYLLENFRSNITLESTAKYVNLAPAYLSTLFSEETGMNFKVYLDNLRFDYALKLLSFTNMSILEICTESGFCDYANFTRRFKKKYNCTPSEYRNQCKGCIKS